MKRKILYMLLFLPLLSFADLNVEKVKDALSSVSSNNHQLSYYSKDKTLLNRLNVKKSNSLKNADILLFPKGKMSKRVVIVDSYSKLKKNKNSIGAIYVKKGRTQIMFVAERLEKKNLKLSNKNRKYIIKECHLSPMCLLNLKK